MAKRKVNTEENSEEVVLMEEEPEEVIEEEVEEVTEEPEEVEEVKPVKEKAVKQAKVKEAALAPAKKYSNDDLIPCRSIVQGRLLMTGPRSKLPYVWYNVGDLIYVEYQDLTALMLTKSKYLTAPLFVIEDEELLQDPFWANIAKIYESFNNIGDIDSVINLPPQQLKKVLKTLPKPFLKTLTIEVSTRIENGTYDSINRIKAFDEVCGTDLMCLVG